MTTSADGTRIANTRIDDGWALCQHRFQGAEVKPASVAITYLDPEIDEQVLPVDIRTWFGSLEPRVIDVYKLEPTKGRRRVSFEIQRGKWPEWDRIAEGREGKELCGAVRAALLRAGVGRPRPNTGVDRSGSTTAAPGASDGIAPARVDIDDRRSLVADHRSRFDFEFIYARRPKLYRSVTWVGSLEDALELNTFIELRQWLKAASR